jgi:hypothetical protein
MSLMTTPVGKYTSMDKLPTTTGSDVQAQYARMMARLVARYKLAAVPGRPEELIVPGRDRGASMGICGKSIRVRLMHGRQWLRSIDFQIEEGWQKKLYDACDTYFGRCPVADNPDLGNDACTCKAHRPTPATVYRAKNEI